MRGYFGRRSHLQAALLSREDTITVAELDRIRRVVSPRETRRPTPLRAALIHGGVLLLWIVLFARAFGAGNVFVWSVGLAYIAYDTALLCFVFVQTLPLLRRTPPMARIWHAHTKLGVIVATHNEAAALPATLAALIQQDPPPDVVVVADDGSDDGTAALLTGAYGLTIPAIGQISASGALHPSLCWLRLPRGGKARALNAALTTVEADLVLTVDADTLLAPGAIAAMRAAFASSPELVAATGVLFPACEPSAAGQLFQWFQSFEYMRNFLSRYAWARQNGLLLISGAFAAYRRQAVLDVGGFDPDCLVEDYELTHRLYDYAAANDLRWRADVVGDARAFTEAPASVGAFLRQRRRWFGGFLQTQVWYRHMVGDARYRHVGTRMLPVKAFDTMQPLYGLTGVALLLATVASGGFPVATSVAGVIAGKIALDLAFQLWSLLLYARWLDGAARLSAGWALIAALAEPFTFQVLRHTGAALGWLTFLRGDAPGYLHHAPKPLQ